jgi:hypothetical protein
MKKIFILLLLIITSERDNIGINDLIIELL